MSAKSKVKIILQEKNLPFSKETIAVANLLGIDKFSFPSEGRFVASVSSENAQKTVAILRKFNREVKIIGKAEKGTGVFLKTEIGSLKKIEVPTGKLIPRIC
jgi:hydrogenase expression/formation protein HypE